MPAHHPRHLFRPREPALEKTNPLLAATETKQRPCANPFRRLTSLFAKQSQIKARPSRVQ
jgi:hypothetical protein